MDITIVIYTWEITIIVVYSLPDYCSGLDWEIIIVVYSLTDYCDSLDRLL